MHCRRARHLMIARLDGHLDSVDRVALEEHLATCDRCWIEWQKVSTLDRLFRSAAIRSAPIGLRTAVMARIRRREQARRAVVGGLVLGVGAVVVALLTLFPMILGLVQNVTIAPALFQGGVETMTQLLILLDTVSRLLLILADQFAVRFLALSSISLVVALALNGLWMITMRRLRVSA